MKRVMIAAAALAIGLGSLATDADAKRLGGGKTSGMSRDTGAMKQAGPTAPAGMAGTPAKPAQAAPAPAATPQPAPAAAKSGMSRWLGPIAGLAAGIGLAALLSHFGMGEAAANFLMIALLVVAVIVVLRLVFRKKEQPSDGLQYAGAGAPASASFERQEPTAARFDAPPGVGAGGTAASGYGIPAGFDVEGFVRQAKLNFVRLQAANDRGDMDDIRQFTTPELFAEIQLQYQERGKAAQQTDVVVLNAELLDVTSEPGRHVASVRFHGQLREDAHAAPDAFDEVWHLVKPTDGSRGWAVAGIQQE